MSYGLVAVAHSLVFFFCFFVEPQVCDRVMETRGAELRGEAAGAQGLGGRTGSKSKFGLSPAAHAAGFGSEGSSGESSSGCCS